MHFVWRDGRGLWIGVKKLLLGALIWQKCNKIGNLVGGRVRPFKKGEDSYYTWSAGRLVAMFKWPWAIKPISVLSPDSFYSSVGVWISFSRLISILLYFAITSVCFPSYEIHIVLEKFSFTLSGSTNVKVLEKKLNSSITILWKLSVSSE